jgi:hypothetical protein
MVVLEGGRFWIFGIVVGGMDGERIVATRSSPMRLEDLRGQPNGRSNRIV